MNPHEVETLTILCDLILPPSEAFKGASDADVVGFIEFMCKDNEAFQPDIRGGIMWLDRKSNTEYGVEFKTATEEQQKPFWMKLPFMTPKCQEINDHLK